MALRPKRHTIRDDSATLYQTTLHYDKNSRLHIFGERVPGQDSASDADPMKAYTTEYEYDKCDRITSIDYEDDTHSVDYEYDKLGRITKTTITNGMNEHTTEFSYTEGDVATHGKHITTPLVGVISHRTTQSEEGYDLQYVYDYDKTGNIIREWRDDIETTYAYDKLGQLLRINNQRDTSNGISGTSWVFTYDRGGNILNKKRYAYTTGTPGTVQQTITYAYGDTNWKDLLTAYNGKAISYDAIGNPETYDGWTYTWQAGRQLAEANKTGTSVQYAYNASGLRVRKTVNGVDTDYTLHGKLVTGLKQGTNKLHFFYDAQSRPAMVDFNGVMYSYVHNLQGDIVGILDNSGALVVEYQYDAWGKPIGAPRTLTTAYVSLANLNPFRYRGYVWDEETGLYYLRSRYYNPEWGRFINGDVIIKYSPLLMNLFLYCGNNSLSRIDKSGQDFLS